MRYPIPTISKAFPMLPGIEVLVPTSTIEGLWFPFSPSRLARTRGAQTSPHSTRTKPQRTRPEAQTSAYSTRTSTHSTRTPQSSTHSARTKLKGSRLSTITTYVMVKRGPSRPDARGPSGYDFHFLHHGLRGREGPKPQRTRPKRDLNVFQAVMVEINTLD